MLTDSDKKWLALVLRDPSWHTLALWAAPLVFTVGVVGNLYWAFHYGVASGLDVSGVLSLWAHGRPADALYVRQEVVAIVKFDRAVFSFGFLVGFVLLALALTFRKRRDKRIVALLKHYGALEK